MDMVTAFLFEGPPPPHLHTSPTHGPTFDSVPLCSAVGSEKLWAPVSLTVILIYAKS